MLVEIQRKTHIQRMLYQEFEDRIRNGELSGEVFVRFEVVTGDEFVPLGTLELYEALADPNRMAFRRNLTEAGVPIVTAVLVGIQIQLYLLSGLDGVQGWLEHNLTNWAPAIIEQHQVYRLLTYGILQTSITHLLFNLYFLAYTGYHLERSLGRANLAILYIFSVFSGGLLSMIMAPLRPSLGASGGVFGLLAAVVILGWKHWEDIPVVARKYFGWALAPYLGFAIVSGLSSSNVDNWGHLGGLLGGALLVTVFDPEVLSTRVGHNRRIRMLAIGFIVSVSLFVGVAGTRVATLTVFSDEHGWRVLRPEQWREGWTFTGDRGWFSPTSRSNLAISTVIHPRPPSIDEVTDQIINRIDSGRVSPVVLHREVFEVDGWPACRLDLSFELSEQPRRLMTLVIVRGVYEHRVQMQSNSDAIDQYEPLFERITKRVEVDVPIALVDAQTRHGLHPHSWGPALELGDAQYRAGESRNALQSYQQALQIDPSDERGWLGLLRVYADYDMPGGESHARAALDRREVSLSLIEAATDVLAQEGQEEEAIRTLDRAWVEMPDNAVLRRIRLQWGLVVDQDLEPSH